MKDISIRERAMSKIKEFIKENLRYILFLLLVGLVGGIFTGIYTLEITDPALIEEAIAQLGGKEIYIVISAVQVVSYAVVFGIMGKLLANKLGLWRGSKLEAAPTIVAVISGLGAGAAMMALELLWFANASDVIKESYKTPPTASNLIASLIYGGIIEELMIRLFIMSLIALIIWRVFFKGSGSVPEKALVIANVISAIAFAAGHIPSTIISIGITPITLIRCFLLNGSAGLLFGWFYRKKGIQYAMVCHAFAHVAMKMIWVLVA